MGKKNRTDIIPEEIFREVVEGRLGDFLGVTHRETGEHRDYLIIYPDHIYRIVPDQDPKMIGSSYLLVKNPKEMRFVYDFWKRKTYYQLKGGERR